MRARTTSFIVFLAGIFVFAMVSHGFAAQASSEQQRAYQQNPSTPQNSPGNNSNPNQAVTPGAAPTPTLPGDIQPGVGNTAPPVARRHVPWGWLLLGIAMGFVIGVAASPRRPQRGTVEDIRRDRVA
jgi:hypothetical protein